jgi:hypothetical protein
MKPSAPFGPWKGHLALGSSLAVDHGLPPVPGLLQRFQFLIACTQSLDHVSGRRALGQPRQCCGRTLWAQSGGAIGREWPVHLGKLSNLGQKPVGYANDDIMASYVAGISLPHTRFAVNGGRKPQPRQWAKYGECGINTLCNCFETPCFLKVTYAGLSCEPAPSTTRADDTFRLVSAILTSLSSVRCCIGCRVGTCRYHDVRSAHCT